MLGRMEQAGGTIMIATRINQARYLILFEGGEHKFNFIVPTNTGMIGSNHDFKYLFYIKILPNQDEYNMPYDRELISRKVFTVYNLKNQNTVSYIFQE